MTTTGDASRQADSLTPALTAAVATAPAIRREASRVILYGVFARHFGLKLIDLQQRCSQACDLTVAELEAKNLSTDWLNRLIRSNPRGLDSLPLGGEVWRWAERHHLGARWFVQDAAAAILAARLSGKEMMLQPVRRPLPMLVTDAAWSRENADTSHIAARPRSYRMLNADDSALIIAYQTIVDVRVGESEFAWDTQRESLRDTRTCIVATLGLSDADSAALSEALHDAQALLTASGCSLGGLRRKKRDPQHQGVESIERDFYWLALRCFEAMNPYEIAARDDVKPSVVKKGISRALSSVGLVSTWKAGAPPRKRQKPRIKHA